MEDYLLYTLKVSICLILFWVFYLLILRNTTFFLLNRLSLLAGLMLSFSIPVLNFSILNDHSINLFAPLDDIGMIEPESGFFPVPPETGNFFSMNYVSMVSVIYLSGISVVFLRLLFSISSIIKLKSTSEIFYLGKIKVVKLRSSKTFSFFNTIFLPAKEQNRLIIEHEMAHIAQFHWFDLIVAEVASIVLWFNPFVILYKRSVRLQHEYLADRRVVGKSNPLESYLDCLLRHFQDRALTGLVSPFQSKTIKKRIDMLTKNKTSMKFIPVYLLAIPLVAVLLIAFTTGNEKTVLYTGNENKVILQADVPSLYPVDKTLVTRVNPYGERKHPITGEKDFHYGIDFAVPEGSEVVSTANGIVVETDMDPKKGNYILIQHNTMYSSFYSHLKSVSVNAGDKLKKGQTIGISGNTGLSTGPHLHYEVIENGERVNPESFLPN